MDVVDSGEEARKFEGAKAGPLSVDVSNEWSIQ
jgi:hypothetical protein